MKMRRYFALCVVLTLMLSLVACGSVTEISENSSVAGPSGKYANKDIYYVYEFNGDKCHSEMLVSDGSNDGTWKYDENEKNKILIEFDDGVDPLTYDAEADTLSLEGVMEFEKISDEEYRELKKSAMELQSAMDALNDKPASGVTEKSTTSSTQMETEYFSECPSMPTPDSVYEGITIDRMDGTEYYYDLGTDESKALTALQIWMLELMSRDFDIEEYDNDSGLYLVKMDGKRIALFGPYNTSNGYGLLVAFI